MSLPGVAWFFEINPIMNILYAKAINADLNMQSLMIHSAVHLIEKAQKYNGIPYEPRPISASKGTVIVHFALIFKNPKDLTTYLEQLKSAN